MVREDPRDPAQAGGDPNRRRLATALARDAYLTQSITPAVLAEVSAHAVGKEWNQVRRLGRMISPDGTVSTEYLSAIEAYVLEVRTRLRDDFRAAHRQIGDRFGDAASLALQRLTDAGADPIWISQSIPLISDPTPSESSRPSGANVLARTRKNARRDIKGFAQKLEALANSYEGMAERLRLAGLRGLPKSLSDCLREQHRHLMVVVQTSSQRGFEPSTYDAVNLSAHVYHTTAEFRDIDVSDFLSAMNYAGRPWSEGGMHQLRLRTRRRGQAMCDFFESWVTDEVNDVQKIFAG